MFLEHTQTRCFMIFEIKFMLKVSASLAYWRNSYQKLYARLPTNVTPAPEELARKINNDAQKMGITRPLNVYQGKDGSSWFGGVNAPGKWNYMNIVISEGDKRNTFAQFLALAYAKENHLLYETAIESLLPFCLFMPTKMRRICAIGLLLAQHKYSYQAQERADLTAAKYCNNLEINAFVQELESDRKDIIKLRNHPDNKELKLKYNANGDLRFSYFAPYPAHSKREDYLTQFIKDRGDMDPPLQVYYSLENQDKTLVPLFLTQEQSAALRQIMWDSPKRDLYKALEKIVIYPNRTNAIVQLFDCGSDHPRRVSNINFGAAESLCIAESIVPVLPFIIKAFMNDYAQLTLMATIDTIDEQNFCDKVKADYPELDIFKFKEQNGKTILFLYLKEVIHLENEPDNGFSYPR